MYLLGILFYCYAIQLHITWASLTADEIAVFRRNNFTIEDNGTSWILNHHGIPEHGFDGGFGDNPNLPSVQNHSYEIPKVPTPVADGDEGCVYLGAMAMAISGAPFYNPYTGGGYNAVEGNCEETFDHCDGHPSPDGSYHYHQLPTCLYYSNSDLRDVFLGVAFDGYPIYGPMDENGKNWTSSELDKCHGHVYKGRYMYRVTHDFPYVMACYRGSLLFSQQPMGGGGGGMGPPPDGQGRPPRQKREVKKIGHRFMYKRQLDTTNCNMGQDPNWQMETCWAFCENPSTGTYDDCPYPGADLTTDGPTDAGYHLMASTWMTSVITCIICFVYTFTM